MVLYLQYTPDLARHTIHSIPHWSSHFILAFLRPSIINTSISLCRLSHYQTISPDSSHHGSCSYCHPSNCPSQPYSSHRYQSLSRWPKDNRPTQPSLWPYPSLRAIPQTNHRSNRLEPRRISFHPREMDTRLHRGSNSRTQHRSRRFPRIQNSINRYLQGEFLLQFPPKPYNHLIHNSSRVTSLFPLYLAISTLYVPIS